MKKLLFGVAFLGSLFLYSGCGDSGGGGGGYMYPQGYLQSNTPLSNWLNSVTVNCGYNCNNSVGSVASMPNQSESEAGWCTGFLVAPDIVGTDSHCIPQTVKSNPSACPNELGIKFANSGSYSSEAFTCKELIYAADIPPQKSNGWLLHPDYAFFRISGSSTRPPLQISRDGFENNGNYTVAISNPQGRYSTSIESTSSCVAIQGTAFSFNFTNPQAPTVSLFGCHTVEGNSGSPIFDGENRVRGVVFAGADDVRSIANNPSMPAPIDAESNVTQATNLSCLSFPGSESFISGVRPSSCPTDSKLDSSALDKEEHEHIAAVIEKPAKEQFNQEITKFVMGLPQIFKFKIMTTQASMTLMMTPTIECVRPESYWKGTVTVDESSFLGFFNKKRIVSVEIPSVSLTIKPQLDRYYRMSVGPMQVSRTSMTANVDLEKLKKETRVVGDMTSVINFDYTSQVFTLPVITHICSPEELKQPFSISK